MNRKIYITPRFFSILYEWISSKMSNNMVEKILEISTCCGLVLRQVISMTYKNILDLSSFRMYVHWLLTCRKRFLAIFIWFYDSQKCFQFVFHQKFGAWFAFLDKPCTYFYSVIFKYARKYVRLKERSIIQRKCIFKLYKDNFYWAAKCASQIWYMILQMHPILFNLTIL